MSSLQIFRNWWHTHPNKVWPIVIIILVLTGDGMVAFTLVVIAADIVAGTQLEKLFQISSFWIPILLGFGTGVVMLLVFVVILLLWAWITLPFTVRAGVVAVERLRLEIEQLRRQMPSPSLDTSDDPDLDEDRKI